MKGYPASGLPTVYSSGPPGGDQIIVSAALAVLPTFPMLVTLPVTTGNILVISVVAVAYANFGVSGPQAQIYVGGVPVGAEWTRNHPHVNDTATITLDYTYTVLADNPALTVELWALQAANNWTMLAAYTSGVQVIKFGT